MKPWTWKIPLLSTYSTTWVLSHRDRNITAAYLCVRPRHRVLYRSLHLHFVAHAKHCHPKSPTNLPPYGSSPQKETAVAWHSHTAPSASVGHAVAKRDGRPPCLTHSIPLYLPSSKSFICPARITPFHSTSPPPVPPPPPKKNPHDNFEELRVPSELGFMNSSSHHGNHVQLCIWKREGGLSRVVVRCALGECVCVWVGRGVGRERRGIVVLVFRVSANQSNCWVFIKEKNLFWRLGVGR